MNEANDMKTILSYNGHFTQEDISKMVDTLERNINNSSLNNIIVVFIELCQNIMNYSKSKHINCCLIKSEGIIDVKEDENSFFVQSQNIITSKDKEKLEEKLASIKTLSKEEVKKIYKELRRSGKNTHGKGGGIGFYEISKKSSSINYEFEKINEDKYLFKFSSKISIQNL